MCRNRWIRLPLTVLSALGIFMSPQPVQARQFPLPELVPPSVPDQTRSTLQSLAQKYADDMYLHLLMRIDEADRISNLAAAQKRKLRVAAKGAVQFKVEEWITPINATYLAGSSDDANKSRRIHAALGLPAQRVFVWNDGARVQLGRFGAVPADRVDEIPLGIKIRAGINQPLVINNGDDGNRLMLSTDHTAVAAQDIWTKTWESTLTRAQHAQLITAQSARHSQRRQSRAQHVVAEIDQRLLLDASQRVRIAALVDDYLQSPRIKNMLLRRPGLDHDSLTNQVLKALGEPKLKGILTVTQLEYWSKLNQPRFNRPNVILR